MTKKCSEIDTDNHQLLNSELLSCTHFHGATWKRGWQALQSIYCLSHLGLTESYLNSVTNDFALPEAISSSKFQICIREVKGEIMNKTPHGCTIWFHLLECLKQALGLQFPVSSCLSDIPTHTAQCLLSQMGLFIVTLPEPAPPPTILPQEVAPLSTQLLRTKHWSFLSFFILSQLLSSLTWNPVGSTPQLYSKYRFSFSSLIQTITISHLYCDKNLDFYVSILSPHSFFKKWNNS